VTSAGLRAFAWLLIGGGSLGAYIISTLLRRLDTTLDPALVAVMVVTTWLGLFGWGSLEVCLTKCTSERV